jgi:hypothetical protein
MSSPPAIWRDDIDALEFDVAGHGGVCLIHRLAFRKLLGKAPAAETCLAFFVAHTSAFVAAAREKIAKQQLPPGRNFHLNSRDVTRELAL